MIYLFHGSDVEKTRAKAFEWVAKAQAKEPNLAYVRLYREDLAPAALEDAALSGGLFVKRLLVLIDDPFPNARAASEEEGKAEENSGGILEERLDDLATSDNAILILAPGLAVVKATGLAAKAKAEYKYDVATLRTQGARGFNTNLVNALATRSHEKLWLEINLALRAGEAPEMVHGLLHWKARELIEKGSRAWGSQEARELSLALIALLQDSRHSGLSLTLYLERFALSV